MGDALSRRRKKSFPIKKILLFCAIVFLVFLLFSSVWSILPQVKGYLTNQWYISPLASDFSITDLQNKQDSADNIKKRVTDAGFSVNKIEEYNDYFTVTLDPEGKVLLSKKKPVDRQISSLQLISSRFTIEGKHFVQLDLRFDRPIIIVK